MLPHKNRLIKRKDFEATHRQGSFFSFGDVAVKARKNGLDETRIGFSVGLKFSKKAAERNIMKRRLREVFRHKLGDLKKGMDIVVVARGKGNENISCQKLEEAVSLVLKKAGLITNNSKK